MDFSNSSPLPDIDSVLSLVGELIHFVTEVRDVTQEEKLNANEFLSNIDKFISDLRLLSDLRKRSDGIIEPSRRSVMDCERQAWCLLHKIEAIIGPLLVRESFGKQLLGRFFDDGNTGKIASINDNLEKQNRAVNGCIDLLRSAIAKRENDTRISHKQSTRNIYNPQLNFQLNYLLTRP